METNSVLIDNTFDLDSLSDGRYSWDTSLPANTPGSSDDSHGTLIQYSDSTSKGCIQECFTKSSQESWIREKTNYVFNPWRRQLNSKDIPSPIRNVTFGSNVVNGSVVRYNSSTSTYLAAIADGTSKDEAIGIADVTNNLVYIYGKVPLFSGLVEGDLYYLSSTTAGSITPTKTSADIVLIGVAASSTELLIDIVNAGVGASYVQSEISNITSQLTKDFDIVAGSSDSLTPSKILGGSSMPQDYTLPNALLGSRARILTPFSLDSTLHINVYPQGSTNPVNVGLVHFVAGATEGSFTSTNGSYTGSQGDLVTVETPSSFSSYGSDLSITVHGNYVTSSIGNQLSSSSFELAAGIDVKPNANTFIGAISMYKGYTIPSGFVNSQARVLTAFTNSASFPVKVYPVGSTTGTTVGHVNFSPSSTVGSFSSVSGSYTGSTGDLVAIESPSSQDPTGSEIAITIIGNYV